MEQKFKAGDKCRIIGYGAPLWQHKAEYQLLYEQKLHDKAKPDNILFEDETYYILDMCPDYVGKEVTIKGSYFDLYGNPQASSDVIDRQKKQYSTSLFAWADEAQLELIT